MEKTQEITREKLKKMVLTNQKILTASLLQKGKSLSYISKELGVSKQRVSAIKKELVEEGVIKKWVLKPEALGYDKKALILTKVKDLSSTHPNLTKSFHKTFNNLDYLTQKMKLISSDYNYALLFEVKDYEDLYQQSHEILSEFEPIIEKWDLFPVKPKMKKEQEKDFLDLILNKILPK